MKLIPTPFLIAHRFLQYSFKGLADLLERLAADRYGSAILKFKELDGSIGAARRCMQLYLFDSRYCTGFYV